MIKLLFIIGAVITQSGLLVSGNGVCDGLATYTLINNPKACDAFFICINAVAYEGTCPEGLYFSMINSKCEDKDTVHCGNTLVECEPTDGDGTTINNPDKCESFYICLNNVPLSVQCPDDLVFNPETELCDTRENYPCENKISPCEGVASGLAKNQNDCEKFFICDNGFVLTDMWCGPNIFFSEELQDCTSNFTEAKCNMGFTDCSGVADNVVLNNPVACNAYFLCNMGQPINMTCEPSKNFNTNSLSCDSAFKCDNDIDSVCVGLANNVFVDNPESCSAYFRCFNELPIAGYCEEPYFFNPATNACDHQKNVDCEDPEPTTINPLCADVSEGAFIANPLDCQRWYRCDNGQAFEGACDIGFYFDPTTEMCDYDELVYCPILDNPCLSKPDNVTFLEIPGSCTTYGRCNAKNELETVECPAGYWFNFKDQVCDLPSNVNCEAPPAPTPDPHCADVVDNIFLPDPVSCDGYIFCKNQIGTLGRCPSGYYFVVDVQGCRHEEYVVCNK